MSRTESERTTQCVKTIKKRLEAGQTPNLRELAELFGLDRGTLVKACQRAKLTLPRGRPKRAAKTLESAQRAPG